MISTVTIEKRSKPGFSCITSLLHLPTRPCNPAACNAGSFARSHLLPGSRPQSNGHGPVRGSDLVHQGPAMSVHTAWGRKWEWSSNFTMSCGPGLGDGILMETFLMLTHTHIIPYCHITRISLSFSNARCWTCKRCFELRSDSLDRNSFSLIFHLQFWLPKRANEPRGQCRLVIHPEGTWLGHCRCPKHHREHCLAMAQLSFIVSFGGNKPNCWCV